MLCSFSCPLLLYHWIAHLILGSFLLVVVEAVAPEVIPAAEDGLHLAPALALRSPLSLGHAHRAPVLTAAPVPTRDPGLQQHTHTHTHTKVILCWECLVNMEMNTCLQKEGPVLFTVSEK